MPEQQQAKKYARIMVMLDALLDTRIATIAQHWGDEKALEVLKSGYHERVEDIFPGISKEEFRQKYDQRDINTLARSTITNMVPILQRIVSGLAKQALTSPFHAGVEIEVNVYPYTGLSNEDRDVIAASIAALIPTAVHVEHVCIPIKHLSPAHCKAQYSAMVMYDYSQWVVAQDNAFTAATALPEVTLIGPALYFVKKPTEDDIRSLANKVVHPFEAVKRHISPLVSLDILHVGFFSMIAPEVFDAANALSTTTSSEAGAESTALDSVESSQSEANPNVD